MKALIRDWLLQSPLGVRIVALYHWHVSARPNRRRAARAERLQQRFARRLTRLLKRDIHESRGPQAAARAERLLAQAKRDANRWWMIIPVLLVVAGCNGGNPATSPTPLPPVTVTPPPVVVVPPVTPAPVVPPPPAFPPTDPRFNVSYYRELIHNAYETRTGLEPLRRQRVAPRIYLRTIDDAGRTMDAFTLDQTASALESTAGSLTGVFGLAGIERGTGTREGQPGWITVRWAGDQELIFDGQYSVCGRGYIGGDLMILYPRSPGCRCSGGPAVRLSTVKHELGHVLGFWHTSNREDLMYAVGTGQCDHNPTDREIYHASVAYTRPIGSLAP